MFAPVRGVIARQVRPTSIRTFCTSIPRPFLENLFGKKEIKKRDEIVKNQDDFESDPEAKITILSEENSPDYKPFDPKVDMADFKIVQWKSQVVKTKNIEATYNSESVSKIINDTYKALKQQEIQVAEYKDITLHDLNFRFQFAKSLQKSLGFDLNDYAVSKSHTVQDLYNEVEKVIGERWVYERNANGIVLRPEDFQSANVYLNEELTEGQQKKAFKKLVDQAREAEEN
ncbi:ribosomal subunit 39S-domain-containing protein [Scheffersomyces xylosifermentans]|uniref:ribosomal subunit 39S-domain-containing protein n=1 Tax=Scheffersomyces xylosifermentans TaxID=1304137 RepID=UPI00315D24AD